MPVSKIDPRVIFASNAPAIDKPPVFSDKTKGWDVARVNGGRPEIKEMNKLQQDTDLKILWLNENSVTPYDESIDYPDGAVALKDGSFKQLVSGAWVEFLDDFANKDEVKRGIANRYDPSLTYNSGESVVLTNGDIAKSTIDGNTNDPNVNMTGWVKTNSASQIFDESGLTQQELNNGVESIAALRLLSPQKKGIRVYLVSANIDQQEGGGVFIATQKSGLVDNGGTVISSPDPLIFWVRVNYESASPVMFGSDGVDDTLAIQKCINWSRYSDMKNRSWKTTSKLLIPSGRVIDLRGSDLNVNNGLDPIFEFETAGDGLQILHGGGVITGTADSFLKCSGTTNNPTAIGHYARQIRLDGVLISSENIDKFLDFDKAVRQVFMHKVHAYTRNGINANGKCVEVKGHGCIIYSSTATINTYGIKLRAPAGGSSYSEGFHFTDCTIDNFGLTFDVTDIYAMSITAGHVGRSQAVGSKVAVFGQPTSSACRDIKFTGVNIAGPIEFAPDGGRDYHAQLTGCVSEMCDGVNIHIKNNAASISISDHRFHTSTNGVGIVCDNNNANIKMNDLTFDTTFVSGVQVKGAFGENCSLRDISYSGTGDSIYLERPILLSGIPVASAAIASYLQAFNAGNLQGSYAVGATIASVNSWFAKGETGEIICELSYSGANAVTQRLDITVPSGMVIPSGTGWNSRFIMTNAASGRMSVKIPYYITSDISGQSISISNGAGNPINADYHSYFGFKRN